MSQPILTDAQLRDLADDAFAVLNWAKRLGLNKERQIEETVRAFRVRMEVFTIPETEKEPKA